MSNTFNSKHSKYEFEDEDTKVNSTTVNKGGVKKKYGSA